MRFHISLTTEDIKMALSNNTRRPKCSIIFFLSMFTFVGFWFGRYSCNYTLLNSSLYRVRDQGKPQTILYCLGNINIPYHNLLR